MPHCWLLISGHRECDMLAHISAAQSVHREADYQCAGRTIRRISDRTILQRQLITLDAAMFRRPEMVATIYGSSQAQLSERLGIVTRCDARFTADI